MNVTTNTEKLLAHKLGVDIALNEFLADPASRVNALKRLGDIVGPSNTAEISYSARQFDAQEAKDMGLVNRVLPADEIEEYVNTCVKTIGGNAPLTMKAVKVCLGEIAKDDHQRDIALCDRVRTEQIFWNLINNAIKFTPNGGSILVALS